MRKFKWLFFAYLALVALVVTGIAVAVVMTPPTDATSAHSALLVNIKSWDPAEIGDYDTDRIAGNIFEALYNYEFAKQPYTLIPEIAESMPEVRDGGKTWVIHLKKGIHYYDARNLMKSWPGGQGPEIKAADFVYSWKRVCNFHLGLTYNYAAIFQDHIEGLDDWFNYTQSCKTPADVDWNRPISGLVALDDYTLQIKLTRPYPQFRFNLAMLGTSPMCKEVVDFFGDKINRNPIGSGPYALSDYLPEQKIVFTANPIYRGGPTVETGAVLTADQRHPHTQRLEWLYYPEDLPRWYAFRQGLLDANDIPKDKFSEAIDPKTGELSDEMKKDGVILDKSTIPWMFYTGFNMVDPVVGKNKALRQAISMAIDRKTYIDIYTNGRGIPATGPIPPGFPTYDPNLKNPYTVFNLDAAKAKLAEAEKFNGGPIPTLKLYEGDTSTTAIQEAEFFVTEMAHLGLTIDVQYNTWARFQELVDNKQVQLFDFGWTADYPDEQTFWQLYYTKNSGAGGVNSTNFSNPDFDAAYEKASVMEPGPERDVLYAQMQKIVIEECPSAFVLYPLSYGIYHNWLTNTFAMDYGRGYAADRLLDFSKRAAWLKLH